MGGRRGGGASKASKGEDEGGLEASKARTKGGGGFEGFEGERRGHLQSLTSPSFEE